MISRFWKSGMGFLAILYILNVLIQSLTIGKYVNVVTDEGVYLYASALVTHGLVPYRDYFLGHLPFWIYINATIFKLTNTNLDIFHFIYVLWVSSTIVPIFLSIKTITKKYFGAIIACLIFLTFPEMVQWDSHFFAMRQASLPFLAWALYFLLSNKRPILSGILLALFGASLFSNYFVIAIFAIAYIVRQKAARFDNDSEYYFYLVSSFLLSSMCYWLLIFAIPNSISNIFGFQIHRLAFTLTDRVNMLRGMLQMDWPYFVLSTAAIITTFRNYLWLGIFNIITIATLVFLGPSFLPHYIVVATIGLTIAIGIMIEKILKSDFAQVYFLISYIIIAYFVTGDYLKYNMIEARSPDFYYSVDILKQLPGPLFTLEPIYAVYAKENISHFYMVVDPRFYDVSFMLMPSDISMSAISASETILLDDHTRNLLSYESVLYIEENFQLVAVTSETEIWTR